MSSRWLCVLALLCLAFPLPAIAAEESSGPDQIHWKNGDLVPPLPRDEALRARALAEVDAAARARLAALPGVTVLPPAQVIGPVSALGPVRVTARSRTAPSPAQTEAMRELEAIWDRIRYLPDDAGVAAPTPDPSESMIDVPDEPAEPADDFGPQAGLDDTGIYPTSPDIAVGRNRVVIVANSLFQVRDRCGNEIAAATFEEQFGLTAGYQAYDARVVFDEWHNRFVMTFHALNNASQLFHLCVCASTDDTAEEWIWYRIPFAAAGRFGDAVSVAVSPYGIYLSGNEFSFGTYTYHGATIVELDKEDIYAAAGVTVYAHRELTHAADASQATSARPAKSHSYPGAMYFVSAKTTAASTYTLYTLTGVPGNSSLASVNVDATAYAPAPNVQQPNASLVRMPDCRVADAVYDAGRISLVQTIQRPGATTTATVRIVEITPATAGAAVKYYGGTTSYFYPAVDIDDFGRLGLLFSRVSTSSFISAEYSLLTFAAAAGHGSAVCLPGEANYSRGSAPHRWGNYCGITRDPVDRRTFWMHGAYASSSPVNTWETGVYLANASAMSTLGVTPPATLFAGGVEGGPFSPTTFSFLLENTGPATANWTISILPEWLTASETSGTVAPYGTETVRVDLASGVTAHAPGLYNASLSIDNCSGTGGWSQMVQLAVGMDFQCPGAGMSLQPPGNPPLILGMNTPDPGVYVTAMENVSLCAVGILAAISSPTNAVVDIYEADGTTRGPLVTSGSAMLFRPGLAWHYIPVNTTLEACKEYEVVVSYPVPWWYDAFSELHFPHPFDVGGAIRVRDASSAGGDPSTDALSHLVLIRAPQTGTDQTDLVTEPDATGAGPDLGNHVEALGTRQLCSITVNLFATPGSRVTASVFELSGGVRSRLVGFGSAFCHELAWREVEIPVSAQMVAGKRYDVAVGVPVSAALRVDQSAALPYEAGPFIVLGGSSGGFLAPDVVDMTLHWTDDAAGVPFDLVKPGGGAVSTFAGPATRGIYVASGIDQEIYSLGVYGDVPNRATVIARVYEATGTTRGALIASGQVGSEAVGKRWHDVPLSATFLAGHHYDLEIEFVSSTAVGYWTDAGLPYTAYGTIEVLDAEQSGNPAGSQLLHYRIHACNGTSTPVDDEPARAPMYLANPVPNPTSGEVRFDYGIDEEGPVEIAIYDVAGRLVGRVFSHDSASRGGAQIRYDASRLASGVYFARLTTKTKSLSRKFVVTR